MKDRVRCGRCGIEIWWWKAYWWRGDPDTPYCSRACAIPRYDGSEVQFDPEGLDHL